MSQIAEEGKTTVPPPADAHIGWSEALGEHATNPETPRTNGDTITALGKDWPVATVETRVMGQFEQWVRKGGKASIQEAEAEGDIEEADKLRRVFIADRGAGHYTWDGRHVRSARGDLPGIQYLVYLILARANKGMTEEKAKEIFKAAPRECGMALAWALGNFKSPVATAGEEKK